ncbi:MAG: LolA family protein, partial [Gemmatimonadota bacterium]
PEASGRGRSGGDAGARREEVAPGVDATAARPQAADPGPAETGGTPDVDALLEEAERAYAALSSLRAAFEQRMEVPLLDRSREGRGVWYQKGRSRFRMDFTEPPDDEVVADGTYLWIYHPSEQPDQVIRSALATGAGDSGAPDLLARILSEARTAYDARYVGLEQVSGVATHVVELTPIGRSPYRRVTVWIGVPDRLVRGFRIVEQNESVRTVTLSDLDPDVALPDSLFRFTPPPGVDVFGG